MKTEQEEQITADMIPEELLTQLFHLKCYERPETSRMTRSRQNIMRQVRQVDRNKRLNLGDLLELNFPWLFAEPKYGIAALFVAFAGLQYLGMNARYAAETKSGIYTSPDRFVSYETQPAPVTNQANYAEIPSNFKLFEDPANNGAVEWAEYQLNQSPKK